MPQIYHGYTMTSRIFLADVLQTIKKYAFVKSQYPVILSIENHCNIRQQKVMAQLLQETFQDMLVSHPCKDNEVELPSPEDLKYKILVKCKGSSKHQEDIMDDLMMRASSIGSEEAFQFSCMQTRKRGILFCKNPRNGCWEPYKCILTPDKLLFIKLPENIRSLSVSSLSLKLYPVGHSHAPMSPGTKSVGGFIPASKCLTRIARQNSFTEEWSPMNFADFELTSSRFSGSIPDMSQEFCLTLEFSVNGAEIERNSGHTDLPHLIRIENGQTLIYAATGKIEEANEWKHAINEVTRAVGSS